MSEPRPIDAPAVRGLWVALSEHFGTRVVPKAGAPLMRAAGAGLELLRIQTRERFASSYTTVIGRRIYVPYEPGDAASEAGLWRQAATAVHEHQHVVQAERDGFARFALRYLVSPRWRADYEAEAYGCDIELLRWAGRTPPEPASIADRLTEYGLAETDRARARERLLSYADAATPRNEATLVAIAWLEPRVA